MSDKSRVPQMPPQSDSEHFKHSYTPPTTVRPPVPKPLAPKTSSKPTK